MIFVKEFSASMNSHNLEEDMIEFMFDRKLTKENIITIKYSTAISNGFGYSTALLVYEKENEKDE